MKPTNYQEPTDKTNDQEPMNKDNKQGSPKGLTFSVFALCFIIAIYGSRINKRLSEISDSIDVQNILLMEIMSKAEENLQADTTFQDAQRLYVQSQQKKPILSNAVFYGK